MLKRKRDRQEKPIREKKAKGNNATKRCRQVVQTCGAGDMGQLGLGFAASKRRERPLLTTVEPLPDKIKQIAAGSLHNLVLDQKGRVYSWGCNDDHCLGTLGLEEKDCFIPQQVQALKSIVQVAAGASHSLALSKDGEVFAWGTYRNKQGPMCTMLLNAEKPFVINALSIAAGENHDLVLTRNHQVWQWGDLNKAESMTEKNKAESMTEKNKAESMTEKNKAESMTEQEEQKDEIKRGEEEDDKVLERELMQFPVGVVPGKVFAGGYTSVVIDGSGKGWAWGCNNYHQTGCGGAVLETFLRAPLPVLGLMEPLQQVACGMHHSLFLTQTGLLFAVGKGSFGRLGLGANETDVSIPTLIPTTEVMRFVACGEAHSLAVSRSGELFTWGMGTLHQLGLGADDDKSLPQAVRSKNLFIVAADGGAQHTLIVGNMTNF